MLTTKRKVTQQEDDQLRIISTKDSRGLPYNYHVRGVTMQPTYIKNNGEYEPCLEISHMDRNTGYRLSYFSYDEKKGWIYEGDGCPDSVYSTSE